MLVTIDDAEVSRTQVTTDAAGKATVKFQLPAKMTRGDGLLTVTRLDGVRAEGIAGHGRERTSRVGKALSPGSPAQGL